MTEVEKKVNYIKIADLVGSNFVIEKAWGYRWKKWDDGSNRYILSEKYEQGFSKRYTIDTDKGRVEVSRNQFKDILEAAYQQGKVDLVGKVFSVKSNGKEGSEGAVYYFNLITEKKVFEQKDNDEVVEPDDSQLDLGDIPF